LAIYRLLRDRAFDDNAVKAMTMAYESALQELGLADRADPLTEIIARKIIECAESGERNPQRLCELAVRSIRK